MKIQYKMVLLGLILIGVVWVSGCEEKEIPLEKYCKTENDCLTSCGVLSGFTETGSNCYNKDFVISAWNNTTNSSGKSPIDGTICISDTATFPFECRCKRNVCVIKET